MPPRAGYPGPVIKLPALQDPVWEQQPGETGKAYLAFRHYRDMGPKRRSLAALAREFGHTQQGTVDRWSRLMRWVERCEAWDSWVNGLVQEGMTSGLIAAARSWEARGRELRETEWEIAQALTNKLKEFLERPTTTVTKRIEREDGVTVEIHEPTLLDSRDIAPIVREVTRLARLAAGMPTEGARAAMPETLEGMSDVDAFLTQVGGAAAPEPSEEVVQ